jgi:hypothetical protein
VLGAGLFDRLGRCSVTQPLHCLRCRLAAPVAQLVGDLLPCRAGLRQAFGLFRAVPGVESGGHVNILSTHCAEVAHRVVAVAAIIVGMFVLMGIINDIEDGLHDLNETSQK